MLQSGCLEWGILSSRFLSALVLSGISAYPGPEGQLPLVLWGGWMHSRGVLSKGEWPFLGVLQDGMDLPLACSDTLASLWVRSLPSTIQWRPVDLPVQARQRVCFLVWVADSLWNERQRMGWRTNNQASFPSACGRTRPSISVWNPRDWFLDWLSGTQWSSCTCRILHSTLPDCEGIA